MNILIPDPSLVMLIGPSGSGKSLFARKHFLQTEVISSDFCRALICDDENNQAVSKDAFDLLHYIARKRLHNGRLTVIDATNVRRDVRKRLFEMAETYDVAAVGIAFNLSSAVCLARNRHRRGRLVDPQVIERQWEQMQRALENLVCEEFDMLYVLDSVEKVREAKITRVSAR